MNLIGIISLLSVGFSLDVDQARSEAELIDVLKESAIASIPNKDIENVVNRLYFDAAEMIIRKAHDEEIDVSVPVRNAVSDLRSKLDHLVKLLDPEYFRPQRVPPAFQWTQNDTAIFIQLKYSRRFNAPGSVDVEDFNSTFTNSSLIFSAIGGHSGKRFEYALNLDFFDEIVPDQSSWNIGSVGKVLLTIAKRHVSKWPRLLLTNVKIDNMHTWYDYGEKLEVALKALPTINESPLTCASNAALFCPTSGKCIQDCADCKSKQIIGTGVCRGSPAYKAKDVNFTDTDAEFGSVRGSIEVTLSKEYHRYDVDEFSIYILEAGKDLDESTSPVAKAIFVNNVTYRGDMPAIGTFGPQEIVAVPLNGIGENREKAVRKILVDRFRPDNCSRIDPITFEDTDAAEGFLKGLFKFTSPSSPNNATNLVFHWGKSESVKLNNWSSSIAEVGISASSHNLTSGTHIPSGASHVLVFAKSSVGEGSSPVGAWAIEDRQRPKGLVGDIRLLTDRTVEFKRFDKEGELTGYTVRTEWKTSKGRSQTEDNEVIPTAGLFTFSNMARTSKAFSEPPSDDFQAGTWKVCVYVTNKMGTAMQGSCVDIIENKPVEEKREL